MRTEEVQQYASDHIQTAVARGRGTCASIVTDTVEYLHGMGEPDALRALAWQLVAPAFAEHLATQSTWPARTDSDRLTDAFRTLDTAGIVAREDFTCCQNCGLSEIGGEVLDNAPARGYVFYHAQDTERAIAGDGLWLAYGRFEQSPTTEIGEEITAALQNAGLNVDWDGSAHQRIRVPMTWARRRHGQLAAFIPGDLAHPEVSATVVRGRHRLDAALSVVALAQLELPWLPAGVAVNIETRHGSMTISREHHRLVCDDGRNVGRLDGTRLLDGEDDPEIPAELGLLEVTFAHRPTGPVADGARPMLLPETMDLLRRMPTRTDSWLCAVSVTDEVVQMRWKDGRLWLETPNPKDSTSTGTYANLDDAERILTILATENRVAIAELDNVTTQPW